MSSNMTAKAEIACVGSVTEFVDGCLEELECPMKTQIQIDVAIDEVLANICSYAYEDEVGSVWVRFEASEDGSTMYLSFEDEGIPFNPLLRPAPDTTLSLAERGIGGYGIYIVRSTMDDVLYERRDNRNILTIVKRIH